MERFGLFAYRTERARTSCKLWTCYCTTSTQQVALPPSEGLSPATRNWDGHLEVSHAPCGRREFRGRFSHGCCPHDCPIAVTSSRAPFSAADLRRFVRMRIQVFCTRENRFFIQSSWALSWEDARAPIPRAADRARGSVGAQKRSHRQAPRRCPPLHAVPCQLVLQGRMSTAGWQKSGDLHLSARTSVLIAASPISTEGPPMTSTSR
jgi:hypothetical protein